MVDLSEPCAVPAQIEDLQLGDLRVTKFLNHLPDLAFVPCDLFQVQALERFGTQLHDPQSESYECASGFVVYFTHVVDGESSDESANVGESLE